MNKVTFSLAIGVLILYSNQFFAQTDSVRMTFGQIEMSALEMMEYEADPNAKAIILGDIGEVRLNIRTGYSEFDHHRRIKILKKGGFTWGDITIPYRNDIEEVVDIQAVTYTLEGGKVVKHFLNLKNVTEEKIANQFYMKKISMPALKEGAIIEYSYFIRSEHFTIPTWYFQHSEPVLYSEYRVNFPDDYEYFTSYQGSVALDIDTEEVGDKHGRWRVYSTNRRTNRWVYQKTMEAGGLYNVDWKYQRRVATNVPALRREPYMTTPEDYRAKIDYQQKSVEGDRYIYTFMKDWKDVSKTLWSKEQFGLNLKKYKNGEVRALVSEIIKGSKNDKEKMIRLYDFVRNKMNWSGWRDLWVDENLNTVWKKKKGDSGEINLMLIMMLREAKINVLPAILSTRNHGQMQPIYPYLDQFNHVIAHVSIEGERYWLNAIHKNRPYDLLDDQDLNQMAFVLHPKNPQWVELTPPKKYVHITHAAFSLEEDGSLTGSIECSDKDYAAYQSRNILDKEGEDTFFRKEFEEKITAAEITNQTVANQEDLESPLEYKCELNISAAATIGGDRIYLNPIWKEDLDENPFKLSERAFPVDYGHGYSHTYVFNLEIPEGYEVEEMPERAQIQLPYLGGIFMYNTTVNGNKLQLMSKISINQILFQPDEYKFLQEFYDRIVEKHAEQIVFKKQNQSVNK